MISKYIPAEIGAFGNNGKWGVRPVVRVESRPPCGDVVHSNSCIKGACALVLIHTLDGQTRQYGFARAWIDSSLRMAVELLPGQERDEVVARWENAPESK